jgi:hypothetical protein
LKSILLLLILLLNISIALSQSHPSIHIQKANSKMVVDAEMNEEAWASAEVADHFKQFFPFDSSYAKAQTEVRVTYDDHALYVFAKMYNLGPRKYVTPSLRRDFRGEGNDGFSLVLDTYEDKTNGFQFGVNPFGVQREGLIANGGTVSDDLSLSWDNKWYSAAKIHDNYWVCEMAIPFKTIRFKAGLSSWNINFYRIDSKYTERSVWSPVPRNFQIFSLAFSGKLFWNESLKKPGPNISIIPYAAASSLKDFEKGDPKINEFNLGGDAKIAINSALNLDLTLNPDFSQVEVDQQVTNLDRFEIFYPERRQFFLENGDLFANFGSSSARPFFSRRIGVTRDPSTGQNINNPIYAGGRLSGKINNNLRVGLLSMQAAEDKSIDLASINYSVLAVQQKIFSRSNISGILVNKQSFIDPTTKSFDARPSDYNTVAGLDYNLASLNGKWSGKFYYHHSFNQVKKDSAFSGGATLNYSSPKIEFSIFSRSVGSNFDAQTGFVRRRNFNQFAPEFYYYFYPKSKIINKHGPGTDIDMIWNKLYGFTDWDANLWYNIRFQNTSNGYVRVRRDYVYLFSAFDPTGTGGLQLAAGTDYNWNSVLYSYQSNTRKKLFFFVEGRVGQYFNGYRQGVNGTISFRLQPYAVISADFSYNRIRLPRPYNSADLILIGPKFDFTFSRKVFWTTYVQYNNQINNLNINSRLQWRFKPVSDLFLVYTDNYFAESTSEKILYVGQPKLRAIVLKLTYWFNL